MGKPRHSTPDRDSKRQMVADLDRLRCRIKGMEAGFGAIVLALGDQRVDAVTRLGRIRMIAYDHLDPTVALENQKP